MNKLLYSLFILQSFSVSLKAQISPHNYNELDLKGNVKLLEEYSYKGKYFFGELEKIDSMYRRDVYEFDVRNRVVKMTRIESDLFIKEYSLSYITSNKFVGISSNVNGKITQANYNFDNHGNIIKFDFLDSDTLIRRELAEYDKNDSLIDYKIYKKEGDLDYQVTYKYDLNGNIISALYYEWNTWSSHAHIYKNNLIIETITFDSNKDKLSRINYSYDDLKRIISKVETPINLKYEYPMFHRFINYTWTYDYNGNLINELMWDGVHEYKYDENSRLISDTQLEDGEPVHKKLYEYDIFNNLAKEVTIYYKYSGGSKLIKSYRYDSKGNWIQMIQESSENHVLSKSVGVIDRIITYRE